MWPESVGLRCWSFQWITCSGLVGTPIITFIITNTCMHARHTQIRDGPKGTCNLASLQRGACSAKRTYSAIPCMPP